MECKAKPSIGQSKIAILGEFPTKSDCDEGEPFTSNTGVLLKRWLKNVGVDYNDCYVTNVFHEWPKGGKHIGFCTTKTEATKIYKTFRAKLVANFPDYPWPVKYSFPPCFKKKYCHPFHLGVLPRLRAELNSGFNVVLALGGMATWALAGEAAITRSRGTVLESALIPKLKVLPTHHPRSVSADWTLNCIAQADIAKLARESEFPEINYPNIRIGIRPTLEDLREFADKYSDNSLVNLSSDIETAKGQITCIGFAPNANYAICIPFWDREKPTLNYWDSYKDEVAALNYVRQILAGACRHTWQNGLYDLQYIWKIWHSPVMNNEHDTMLLHHSLYPDMPKGLGFLGATYTDFPSWKFLRKQKADVEKADE